jgi:ATP-dependent Clp protease ATP-binding subunit ClpA
MFSRIRQRLRDMKTIGALCSAAERHANTAGLREPGAEHFVLAALELPDGTARQSFVRAQLDPDDFPAALLRQRREALRKVGIDVTRKTGTASPVPASSAIYSAQPSAQALMQQLAREARTDSAAPLLGAHVIIAATRPHHGTAVRAFRAMGVDPAALAAAAAAEVQAFRAS